MFKKLAAVLAGLSMMVASSVYAVPLGNGPSVITSTPYSQPSLQSLTDTVLGSNAINVYNDQSGVGVWQQAESDVSAYQITFGMDTGGAPINGILGIYDYNDPTKTYNLLDTTVATGANFKIKADGTLVVNNTNVGTDWSGSFGYFLEAYGIKVFTEDDKNANNDNMAATYVIPSGTNWNTTALMGGNGDSGVFLGGNDWLLAFELNPASSDPNSRDFNDGLFLIEDMQPVPEPGTMVLLGAGMLGLAIFGKRRMNREA